MSWAEFRIRSYAFHRMEKNKLLLIRELAWTTYIAPYQDSKKMKRTREEFWRLEQVDNSNSNKMLDKIRSVQAKFKEELKMAE